MYTCKCWNKEIFTENYTDSRSVYLSPDGELLKSDSDPQLIEVCCDKCWESTEDKSIFIDEVLIDL